MKFKPKLVFTIVSILVFVAVLCTSVLVFASPQKSETSTPIKHVVVLFQENISFDHYFGTYPNALNPQGEPSFKAASNTPSVNGLTDALLQHNPNTANPKRLDRTLSDVVTCDQDHGYTDEQKAFDQGKMDKFVEFASGGGCTDKSIVMDYYDGNTVTAMWNYAQQYAMSDNSFSSTFGPSTPGALNLVSGQTHGATPTDIANNVANGTIIGDPRPLYDDCSPATSTKVALSNNNKNVGDLLNAQNVTWGWFQGGFKPSSVVNGVAICNTTHNNVAGGSSKDYIPHHEPFQYYTSTANPHHLPPSSVAEIGQKTDQANHQYDLSDFWAAVNAGNMPAVSYLKAAAYQDGHAGYSDPLDEQMFLVDTINALQKRPEWGSTAVIVAYDDSDGWYDHVMGPIVMPSASPQDALTGTGACGTPQPGAYQDHCGYGPRQPLLVISPFAKHNFVDHTVTDQSSILRFIEDNWNLGRIGNQSFDALAGTLNNMLSFQGKDNDKLILNDQTGESVHP